MSLRSMLKNLLVSEELEAHVDAMKKPVGELGYDPWGFNIETGKVSLGAFKIFYDHYFRVEARGLENIPTEGRMLVIPNHSGQLPLDALLIGTALVTNDHGPRAPRVMVERFLPTVPFFGNMINRWGGVVGDPVNCARMLEKEECIIVFPEGVRGSGKIFKDRYQLKRFGNGFMHLAMEYNTPIVPVGVVGCEETIPSLHDMKPLAKILGMPYIPLALPFVLPAKVILNFGKPISFTGSVDSESSVTEKVEQVKEAIQGLIKKGLSEREGWFK